MILASPQETLTLPLPRLSELLICLGTRDLFIQRKCWPSQVPTAKSRGSARVRGPSGPRLLPHSDRFFDVLPFR